MTAQAGCKRSM